MAPALPEINKPSTNILDRFQFKPKLSLVPRATRLHLPLSICTTPQMAYVSSRKYILEGRNTMEGCTEYFQLKLVILDKELKFTRNDILDMQIKIFALSHRNKQLWEDVYSEKRKYFNIIIYL